MGGFFKSKDPEVKTTFEQDPRFSVVTDKQSADLAARIGQPGPAFTGERIAPLTALQRTGINRVTEFANAPVPEEFALARNEFVRQLSPTDPQNTLLFKAIQEGAKRNLQQTLEQRADFAGGTGRAFSGARLEQESKAIEGTTINLNQILGELALEQERQRIQAARDLPGIAEQIAQFPLRQAEAAITGGEVERSLQQGQLDVNFEEFIRRFVTEPQNVSALANQFISLGAPQPITTEIPGEASPFAQILPLLTTAAGAVLGPAGAALGSSLGNFVKGKLTPKTVTL